MKLVTIHTDGACEGNPGPGGWAAILQWDGKTREISGGEPVTTNNRMELQAAIEALRSLEEPCRVELFTDSIYLRDGITSWIAGWKRRAWMTTEKKPVKNADLWRSLDALVVGRPIAWRWVKGHAGHDLNERCDQLAVAEIARLKQRRSPDQLKAVRKDQQEPEKQTDQLNLF